MKVSELFNLKNKIAIVTGGTTGLGLQHVTALAEAGVNIVIASIGKELCESVSERIKREFQVDSLPIDFDITKEKDVELLVKKTIDYFGRIDILVNNAGIVNIENSADIDLSGWKKVIDVNLNGLFLCCKHVGQQMIKQKYGKIINIASAYSLRGRDWRNYVPAPDKVNTTFSYSASKGGVSMFTKDLSVDWAKYNITVNAISPGCFMTEMTEIFCDKTTIDKLTYRIPMGRWGKDDDLKGATIFLASDASKYVTGQNIVVDGGWTVWC
jgi:NAD(P)-dependent dehydrogenase (short-subunit alcohol dehydrogenase family)